MHFADLDIFWLDDGRHRIAAFAEPGAIHSVAVVDQHQGSDDGPGVLGPHVELFAQGFERDFEIFDQRIGFILAVEGVFV